MNWDDLRVFIAVARGGTLAIAAKVVGLDATTVSRRVDRLAGVLGTTLFESGLTGHVLTEGGTRLLLYAEAIERSAIAARGAVAGERGALSGTIRVSVAEGFGTWVVARHLPAFNHANPNIVVELVASNGFLNLSKREADVAVMLAQPRSGPLVVSRLTEYRLRLYAASSYLVAAPPLVSRADLEGHTLIGYMPDLVYSPMLDYLGEIAPGLEPALRSSSINAQAAMTVAGAGVCMLPCFIADRDAALRAVILGDPGITRSFWLVVHKDVRRLARVAAFVDWLGDVVRAERQLLLGDNTEVAPITCKLRESPHLDKAERATTDHGNMLPLLPPMRMPPSEH